MKVYSSSGRLPEVLHGHRTAEAGGLREGGGKIREGRMEPVAEKLPDISAREIIGKVSYEVGVAKILTEVYETDEAIVRHLLHADVLLKLLTEKLYE